MKLAVHGNGDLVIVQSLEHHLDELGNQQGDVAAGRIGGFGVALKGFEPNAQSLQRPAILATVVNHADFSRQRRQFLLHRGDHDQRVDNLPQQTHDALQHQFRTEGQFGLGSAHPAAPAATKDDSATFHDLSRILAGALPLTYSSNGAESREPLFPWHPSPEAAIWLYS